MITISLSGHDLYTVKCSRRNARPPKMHQQFPPTVSYREGLEYINERSSKHRYTDNIRSNIGAGMFLSYLEPVAVVSSQFEIEYEDPYLLVP